MSRYFADASGTEMDDARGEYPFADSDDASWQPIDTAPKDGTEIQARIPGHGSDNVIAWHYGLLDDNENECGGWVFTRDQEPPDCWSDGVCWEKNEDMVQSVLPTHWKTLP